MRTGLLDALAAATTGVADTLGLHCAKHRSLHANLHAAAFAGGAGFKGRAVLGASAMTMVARLHARDAQLLLGSLGDLVERHLDANTQVGTTIHSL